MKIGVVAQYLDTRRDIVEVIQRLALKHEIVVYARQADAEKFTTLLSKEIIVSQIPDFTGFSKFFILIWQYLYLLFGQIPDSRYNYYMTERIKLLNPDLQSGQKIIQSVLLLLSKITPDLMSYDQYLNGFLLTKNTLKIPSCTDVFLCFTEIYHDWTLAQILGQNKPVWVYVYSWDHPCKMKTFSKKVKYLVWNDGIKNDLIDLQNIDPEKIYVWGATQFAYIDAFLAAKRKSQYPTPVNSPYIYLGCATGYESLATEEVKYCGQIATKLLEILPQWKLLVRPYPFLKNERVYHALNYFPNVILDTSQSDNLLHEKFIKIRDAQAFFHFGTTMGYEASYFDTPSFLIDLTDIKKDKLLNGFVHQYQNDKYLNQGGSNVIKSKDELETVLKNIYGKKADLYNNENLRKTMKLQSFDQLSDKLTRLIKQPENWI